MNNERNSTKVNKFVPLLCYTKKDKQVGKVKNVYKDGKLIQFTL